MAIETELKLRIAPEYLAGLKRHPLLRLHQQSRPHTRRVYSIYFDTPKLKLQQAGIALRLRRSGRRWVQTLKGGGEVQGGLHQRLEWETAVRGPALEPDKLAQVQIPDGLSLRNVHPVFVTDISRNSRIMQWQGAQIELSIDQGEITTAHERVPLCEIELELLTGSPVQLFGLALEIFNVVPCELETVSKAEQGYRLHAGMALSPVRSSAVKLKRQETAAAAMQRLIWSVMLQVQGNLAGLAKEQNEEYLHQLRVGLRRLRLILRIAYSMHQCEVLDSFRQEFSRLCKALGTVREWDVLMANILQPLCNRMPQDGNLHALLETGRQLREDRYHALMQEVTMHDWQSLLLRFGMWMLGDYWEKFTADNIPAEQYAVLQLDFFAGRLTQAAQNVDYQDAARLHEMRILAKKLRYGSEFFASMFGRHKVEKYLAILNALQDVLGQINDDTVALGLLETLSQSQDMRGGVSAVSLVRGWIMHDQGRLQEMLEIKLRDFQQQRPFW